jgi:RND family efflux transporter MFP subunit
MSAEVDVKRLAIVREQAAGPKRLRRPQVVSRYVIPGVLVAGFVGLVAWASRNAILPPQPVWVVPVLASQSRVQNEGTPLFQAAGWIEPRPTPVRVAAIAPGVVERLLVVEDQAVKAGEPVAELVRADAELARDSAQAQLELRLAEQAESQAKLEAATAVFDAKQAATGVVATRSVQEAESARDAAKARVDVARARVELARVALAEAKLRLDRMTVRAPIDGRVYQLVAYPGSTLAGGMGPVPNSDGSTVVTLYRPDMLQIRADVRFEDIPKVSLGQPVLVNNPALGEPLPGKVLFVGSEANIQKNTLEVKVVLDAPAAVLKPEMLVEVTYLAPKSAASVAETSEQMRLYAPQQLVQRDGGGTDGVGTYVWVADQSAGAARKKSIVTGVVVTGGLIEVTQGLDVASRLIARGHESLADGDRICVVNEGAERVAGGASAASAERPLDRLPHEGE